MGHPPSQVPSSQNSSSAQVAPAIEPPTHVGFKRTGLIENVVGCAVGLRAIVKHPTQRLVPS
jgi:hypothetical protein